MRYLLRVEGRCGIAERGAEVGLQGEAGGFRVTDCLERCSEEMAVCVDDVLRHLSVVVVWWDEQLEKTRMTLDEGQGLVWFVCLAEVHGCDATDTTLTFTILSLSDHDNNRAVGSSCSGWSCCCRCRQCCNGPLLIQQAFPR